MENTGIKIWIWAIAIVAIIILSVIIFCHVAYWLMCVGAATVAILGIAIAILAAKALRKIKQDTDQ